MVQLRHGHVKVPAQTVFQAAQHLPLIFQRSRVGNVNFEGEKTDRHVTHRRRIFLLRSNEREGPALRTCASYCADRGEPPPGAAASAAVSFCTWKHSRMSPTFTSLKLSMRAPHSKPRRTSLQGCLKRRSAPTLAGD